MYGTAGHEGVELGLICARNVGQKVGARFPILCPGNFCFNYLYELLLISPYGGGGAGCSYREPFIGFAPSTNISVCAHVGTINSIVFSF